MQGVGDVPGDLEVEAGQAVYNASKSFIMPCVSGSAQNIDNISTGQFMQIQRNITVVDSLIQLPQSMFNQLGPTQGNLEVDVLCHGLQKVPEEEENEEADEQQCNYILFDASCID